MLYAYCVKKCPHYKRSCERGYISISNRHQNNEELLKSEDGNFYCCNGQLLTVYDKICEYCGEELIPHGSREDDKNIIAIYKCMNCDRTIEMDVIY